MRRDELSNNLKIFLKNLRNDMEENPFADFTVDSAAFLDDLDGRQLCPECRRSRKYFCYTCFVPLPCVAGKLPSVKLPFKVHVIKHPREVSGKSTACHAAVLAPDDVTVYHFPDIPEYENTSGTILLSPGPGAVSLRERVLNEKSSPPVSSGSSLPDNGVDAVDTPETPDSEGDATAAAGTRILTVVFIDSTWYQVHTIISDRRVAKLPRVELLRHETRFWRPQHKPSTYLSTIEAIYYAAREHYDLVHDSTDTYRGQYDNLLFFFVYFYNKIRAVTATSGKVLKAYQPKRAKRS